MLNLTTDRPLPNKIPLDSFVPGGAQWLGSEIFSRKNDYGKQICTEITDYFHANTDPADVVFKARRANLIRNLYGYGETAPTKRGFYQPTEKFTVDGIKISCGGWQPLSKEAVDELIAKALNRAKPKGSVRQWKRTITSYEHDPVVLKAVRARAGFLCEFCEKPAEYFNKTGAPLFEGHHVWGIKNGDGPQYVVAIHANCHDAAHRSKNAKQMNEKMFEYLKNLYPQLLGAL